MFDVYNYTKSVKERCKLSVKSSEQSKARAACTASLKGLSRKSRCGVWRIAVVMLSVVEASDCVPRIDKEGAKVGRDRIG